MFLQCSGFQKPSYGLNNLYNTKSTEKYSNQSKDAEDRLDGLKKDNQNTSTSDSIKIQ